MAQVDEVRWLVGIETRHAGWGDCADGEEYEDGNGDIGQEWALAYWLKSFGRRTLLLLNTYFETACSVS